MSYISRTGEDNVIRETLDQLRKNKGSRGRRHQKEIIPTAHARGKLLATNCLRGFPTVRTTIRWTVTVKTPATDSFVNSSGLSAQIGNCRWSRPSPGHDIGRVSMVGTEAFVSLQMKTAA